MSQAVVILGLVLLIGIVCYLSQRGKTTYVVREVIRLKPEGQLGEGVTPYEKAGSLRRETPRIEKLQHTGFRIAPGRPMGYAYDPGTGPYPGKSLNVPVPRGSLKLSSETYGFPFYQQYRPLHPYDFFRPYGPNQPRMQKEIGYASTPTYASSGLPGYSSPEQIGFGYAPNRAVPPGGFPKQLPVGYSPPYTGFGDVPFYSSVSSFAPFPEINTPWEKVGLLSTIDPKNDAILNLYRRPIAPLQDLFDYAVQDKNGFIIKLRRTNFLEDGDVVSEVIGKESLGPWRVTQFIKDKYVWA